MKMPPHIKRYIVAMYNSDCDQKWMEYILYSDFSAIFEFADFNDAEKCFKECGHDYVFIFDKVRNLKILERGGFSILEIYYNDRFGKYEGMPNYSELTQEKKDNMRQTLNYNIFAANWHLKRVARLMVEPIFKFTKRILNL